MFRIAVWTVTGALSREQPAEKRADSEISHLFCWRPLGPAFTFCPDSGESALHWRPVPIASAVCRNCLGSARIPVRSHPPRYAIAVSVQRNLRLETPRSGPDCRRPSWTRPPGPLPRGVIALNSQGPWAACALSRDLGAVSRPDVHNGSSFKFLFLWIDRQCSQCTVTDPSPSWRCGCFSSPIAGCSQIMIPQ